MCAQFLHHRLGTVNTLEKFYDCVPHRFEALLEVLKKYVYLLFKFDLFNCYRFSHRRSNTPIQGPSKTTARNLSCIVFVQQRYVAFVLKVV